MMDPNGDIMEQTISMQIHPEQALQHIFFYQNRRMDLWR
jgi:hypothetical protein